MDGIGDLTVSATVGANSDIGHDATSREDVAGQHDLGNRFSTNH